MQLSQKPCPNFNQDYEQTDVQLERRMQLYAIFILRGDQESRFNFLNAFATEIGPDEYVIEYHSPGCECLNANYINTVDNIKTTGTRRDD